MQYSELVTQIKSYANRSDNVFNGAVNSFIQMGQQRIWRELSGVEFEKVVVNGTFESGNALVRIPADWCQTVSFMYGTEENYAEKVTTLYLRTYEFCRQYWTNSNEGKIDEPPLFYAEYKNGNFLAGGNYFFLSPTPFKDFKYELIYLKKADLIGPGKSNNILSEKYPDLLFYACFLEALAYLKDDERIQIYEANYQRALESARKKVTDRYTDRSSKRDIS